jgi:spore maturation protein CgeB
VKRKLRIGLHLIGVGTFDVKGPGNVQGDELVARCWQKYLSRNGAVDVVRLYGREDAHPQDVDVVIHFHPDLETHPRARNFLYLQNAFPAEMFDGGTVGVFQRARERYDGYLFTSLRLMKACAPGAVIPFATDPELFHPDAGGPDATDAAVPAVTFVGNNIRGERCNQRYLEPALPYGLAIYGNNLWQAPLSGVCRGKLPMEDLPGLYARSAVNLNAHIPDHITFDTLNQRLYDILACGGFVISDRIDSLEAVFEDAVISTEGHDDLWAKLAVSLADPEDRRRRAAHGRRLVLEHHTFAQRSTAVVQFLAAA